MVAVSPCNTPPLAIDDINNTLANVNVDGNVLTNDGDLEGDALVVTFLTSPSNGTLITTDIDGNYEYSPNAEFAGIDSFLYEICEKNTTELLCDTAVVFIEVVEPYLENIPPVANHDVIYTHQNVAVSGNTMINDYDVDDDPFLMNTTLLSTPTNGTVSDPTGNGDYIYTPNPGFLGEDYFTYQICEIEVPTHCDTATVTIYIEEVEETIVNNPPLGIDDAASTIINEPVSGTVLPNDLDPDGDALVITPTIVSNTTHGTVDFQADGSYTYTPDPEYIGPDQFVYEVCDGSLCATATVYLTVYPDPCVSIELRVFLEGSLFEYGSTSSYDTVMRANLSIDRSVLPGQTPTNPLVSPTPAGHPYAEYPWAYLGNEGDGWTDLDYENVVRDNDNKEVIDWVYVSFRWDIGKPTEFANAAALLLEDGTVVFVGECYVNRSLKDPFYILVEHRNHLGIMSQYPLNISNGKVIYDFTTQDSYRDLPNPTGFGQKEVRPGVFAMFAGDCAQENDVFSYDITGADKILWSQQNGNFDQYLPTDLNLNGDVNGNDKIIWNNNNGISSRVPKN